MAIRPVFISKLSGNVLVDIQEVEFKWFAGLSLAQKQKNIRSLHQAYSFICPDSKILEVSSKSENNLGVKLSAFNLSFKSKSGKFISVENIFQSSKVFKNGGPYKDLIYKIPKVAKTDERIKNSGNLIYFEYQNIRWPLEPKTAFYDWIYFNVLVLNQDLKKELMKYNSFTDIEFNPKKSINCQAYSVALFVSLIKRDLIKNNSIPSKDDFIGLISNYNILNSSQGSLL